MVGKRQWRVRRRGFRAGEVRRFGIVVGRVPSCDEWFVGPWEGNWERREVMKVRWVGSEVVAVVEGGMEGEL